MYSPTVLEHLDQPRNVGELEAAAARGVATNPVCGDWLQLDIALTGEVVSAARFLAQACPPCIASGSVLTELILQQSLTQVRALTEQDIQTALGMLPRNKLHCATLALDVLQDALAKLAGEQ